MADKEEGLCKSRTFPYELVHPNENSLVEILDPASPSAKLR